MKDKITQNAEDILMNENISEVVSKTTNKEDPTLIQAQQIYNYLKTPKQTFSQKGKNEIKTHVQSSINKFNRKKKIQRWISVAAIFIIGILGSYSIYQKFADSDIVNFAKNLEEIRPNEETRLFLQGGQEVLIRKEESTIEYEKNGKNISIGTEEKVVQKLDTKKPVYNTVVVPYGRRTEITLCEGTKVWINSGSKLVYPAVFEKNKREVYIEGEAIFEVTHAEEIPFFVNSRDFTIKVTGTIFNVSSYADDINSSAVLERGKIELYSNERALLHREKINVSPCEIAIFDPELKAFQQKQINPLEYLSWRKGYYIFRSEKLSNILKRIARYYNVEISIENQKWSNETFTGSLDLKDSPEKVLQNIIKTIPIKYTYKNNIISIY